ncbi:MAG: hypothetical protein R2796_00395 [Chitinophagaceae bacterium]|nr:hypothetical protein [Chitinophagaceae bacterium]HQU55913.1 hypothetical protein [Chitinophagaceae bacterium]
MKKLFILVTGLLLFACNSKDKTNDKTMFSDLINDNLKGDITSIEETPYQVDSSGAIGAMDSCCIVITDYDENGNVIKNTRKGSDGSVKTEVSITRYDNGEFKSSSTMKDGKQESKLETIQDENGKYSGGTEYDSAGNMSHYYTDLTQNDVGEILSGKRWKKDSTLDGQFSSTYNKHQRLTSSFTDSSGKVVNTSNNTYNDKGELSEQTMTTIGKNDSTTTKVTKYRYDAHDDNGNWTQRTEMDENGKPTKIVKRTYTYKKSEEDKKE